MNAQARRAAALVAAVSAAGAFSAGTRSLAGDAIISKDAGGTIRVVPYTLASQYKNAAYSTPQEDAFWTRNTAFLNTFGSSTSYGSTYFENEKSSYPKAMLSYIWGVANANTTSINAAKAYLIDNARYDTGNVGGSDNTDLVDLYPSFTLKGQMPKYFFFGQFSGSTLGTTSGYLYNLYPAGATGENAGWGNLTYLQRMQSAFGKWTSDTWVQPTVATTTGGWTVANNGHLFADPLYRPNQYYSTPGVGWTEAAFNSWVDVRNTDNLKAMREAAAYLAAQVSGNPGNMATYKARLQQVTTTLYRTGQSEWDSENYWAWSIGPNLSMLDYATDPALKKQAKANLDYYMAAGAMKYLHGGFGGPTKRDYGGANVVFGAGASHTLYQYFGSGGTWADTTGDQSNSYHAMLSSYRPPQAVVGVANKIGMAGAEFINTKPSYANWADPGSPQEVAMPDTWETLYYRNTYTIGSCVSAGSNGDVGPFKLMSNNAARGVDFFVPYTTASATDYANTKRAKDQVGQYRDMAIWLRPNDGVKYQFQAPASATFEQAGGIWFFRTQDDQTWIAVRPINLSYGSALTAAQAYPGTDNSSKALAAAYANETFHTATLTGSGYAGFAMEVGETGQFASYAAFKAAMMGSATLDLSQLASGVVTMTNPGGQFLRFGYNTVNDIPSVYRNSATPYAFTDPSNYALYKPVTAPDATAVAPTGTIADGATPTLTATAKGYATISLGWKSGNLRVINNGYDFTSSVDAAGNASFAEVADATSGGVAKVEFYLNGKKVGEDTAGATWSLTSSPLAAGRYSLQTRATDIVGNVGVLSATSSFDVGTVRVWGADRNDQWLTNGNWTASPAPNGTGQAAYFGNAITAPRTILQSATSTITVTSLQFNSTFAYTLGSAPQTWGLSLTGAAGYAQIQVLGSGGATINLPISLAVPVNIDTLGGNLTLAGALTTAGNAMRKYGTGTWTTTSATNFGNNTQIQINEGTAAFATTASPVVGTGVSVTVAAGATLNVNATGSNPFQDATTATNRAAVRNAGTFNVTAGAVAVGNLEGDATGAVAGATVVSPNASLTADRIRQSTLTINGSAGFAAAVVKVRDSSPTLPSVPVGADSAVSVVTSLSIAGNGAGTYYGTLDLGNNDLIIDYTGTSPRAAVELMLRSGYNGGSWNGKGITSSTAATNGGLYALVTVDNAALGVPLTSFDNIPIDVTTLIVKFSWAADIDGNGLVTPNDAIAFSNNYAEGAPATHLMGDLNYSGVFDPNDAIAFANAYNESLAHLPEPASLALLLVGAAGLLGRRLRG